MEQRPIHDELEACRPDSNDLAAEELRRAAEAVSRDPGLARKFEQQQRYDAQLAKHMRRVEPPAGLADRLLARLAEADLEAVPLDPQVAAPLPLSEEFPAEQPVVATAGDREESPVVESAPAARVTGKRRWLAAAGVAAALAASLLLIVAVQLYWAAPGMEVSQEEFKQKSFAWLDTSRNGQWSADFRSAKLHEYPLQGVTTRPPQRFQIFDPDLQHTSEMIAYDFSRGRFEAYLFMAKTEYRMPGLQNIPPATSLPHTGPWHLAAWRNGPMLYVLVHNGNQRQFEELMGGSGPIALSTPREAQLLAFVAP